MRGQQSRIDNITRNDGVNGFFDGVKRFFDSHN
jgi:hypothetical protein